MLTSNDCIKKYGLPNLEKNMLVLPIPSEFQTKALPTRVYCNKDLADPLLKALANLKKVNLLTEIHSWEGCFCIRKKRGSSSYSLHSWGVAIDINASTNKMGSKPTLTPAFVKCFKDAGFDWGGDWKSPDGMHFQLTSI